MSLEEQVGRIATALERIASAMEASTSQQVVVGSDAAAQVASDAVAKAAGKRRTSRGSTEKETTGSPEPDAAESAASTETPSSSETGAPAQEETPPPAEKSAPTEEPKKETPAGRTVSEVQTLATSLATVDRAKALAVVNKYAARIGLIPEEQLSQVYADLQALQAELKGQDAFS